MSQVLDPPAVHPAVAGARQVCAGLEAMRDASLWSMGDEQLLALRASLEQVAARLGSVTLAVTRQIDGRGAAVEQGAPWTAAWLRSALRLHPATAKREVDLAKALDRDLPVTAAALDAGQISVPQAQVVAASVQALPAAAPAELRREGERFLVEQAKDFDPGALAHLGRHLARALDPAGGAALEREEARRVETNAFTLVHDLDGRRLARGSFDPEAGALIDAALDAVSAPRPAEDGTPDPRTPARRRAEGLLELLRIAAGAPQMPEAGGEPVTVVVTTPLAVLEDRLEEAGIDAAVLEDGSPLSPESARRLACDALLIAAVLATTSEVLDIGRMSRAVPRPMRRALVARDKGCAFPGCGRPPRWCHAHHIWHWALGGPTSLNNLVLLCGHHHRVIHHHGWTVHIDGDGLPVFTPPRWIDPEQLPRPANNTLWRRSLGHLPLRT